MTTLITTIYPFWFLFKSLIFFTTFINTKYFFTRKANNLIKHHMHFPPRIYNLSSSNLRRLFSHIRILLIKGFSKFLWNYINIIKSEVYTFFNNFQLKDHVAMKVLELKHYESYRLHKTRRKEISRPLL